MRIVVCAKHVVDSTEVRFDEAKQEIVLRNLPTKISDYDRNAMEAAVVLKETNDFVDVDVLTIGGEPALKTLREAVAMGADKGYLIEGGWDDPFDPVRSARVIARAVEETEVPDLLMCGLVSEDGYSGVAGPAAAALLGMTYLAPVVGIKFDGEAVVATLDLGEVLETVRAAPPCVLGIDSSMNVPRLPTVLQVMKVKNDRIVKLTLADLGLDAGAVAQGAAAVRLESYASGAVERRRILLTGGPEATARDLVSNLTAEGVLA